MIWGLNLTGTPKATSACHRTPLLYFTVLLLGIVFKLQTELDNLSIRLEECSLQRPEEGTPHSAQICVASVAVVTDADKQGEENTMMVFSREWVHSKTSLRSIPNTLFITGERFLSELCGILNKPLVN
jgi:hypothetical protein